MAKTATERKREQRERDRRDASKDRLDVVLSASKIDFLRKWTDYKDVSQAAFLEALLSDFMDTLNSKEWREMNAKADAKRAAALQRDRNPTMPLFVDDEPYPPARS